MPKITLDLTEDQWAELIAAVHTKRIKIEEGEYDESDGENENEQWAKELEDIEEELGLKLDEANIIY